MLVVLAVLQGLFLVLVGAGLLLADGEVVIQGTESSAVVVQGVGVVVLVVGLVEVALGVLLARGGHRARAVFGSIVVFNVAIGVYSVVALRDFQVSGVVALLVSVGVLWLLYGSPTIERFFAR